jgi:hypothetical protein
MTSVTIPGTVTNIGYEAFAGCTEMTNVAMVNSILEIEDDAFDNCTSLADITIPQSVTNLGDGTFTGCTALTSVFFQGSAPTAESLFLSAHDVTVYYLSGTTGWGSTFDHQPAVLWNPLIQTNSSNFGLSNNQFGFNIVGTAKIPIVLEACTNLANPVWIPLQTLTLTNGLFYFSEPFQTNSPGRFYRISSP